ncbi:hypothetical protein ACFWPV_10110 [Streptomyces uncialis]|uniref:hypothetical protein n=1 Tax=Streptomyces uncialis TaxID=1048205 RepID=UPI0036504F1D
MIEYGFLAVGMSSVVYCTVALRGGPLPGARYVRGIAGSGVHRITRGQLQHDNRMLRHQLAGAAQYIGGLDHDRQMLSLDVETARDKIGALVEQLTKAELRIGDLTDQLRECDGLRIENTRLQADLANALSVHTVGAAPPPVHVATDWRDREQEFLNGTPVWRT